MTTNVVNFEHTPKSNGVTTTGVLYGQERLKVPISLVKGIKPKVLKISTLGELFETIQKTDGDFYEQSLKIQKLATDKPLEYKKRKETSINGFIVGEFSKRAKKDIIKYVPLLVFDFDDLDVFEYQEIIDKCHYSPYIFACFPSPSYLGIRLMVWTDSTTETHTNIYKNIQLHLSDIFKIPTGKPRNGGAYIDKATSDYSRYWCFTSVGDDFYFNLNSRVFKDEQCFDFVNKPGSKKTINKPIRNETATKATTDKQPLTENQKIALLKSIVVERGKQRNCTVFDLACMLFEHGLNDGQVLSYCTLFEDLNPSNPFNVNEIKRTVDSASKKVVKAKYNDKQLLTYGNKILGFQSVNNIIGVELPKDTKKTVKTAKNKAVKRNDKTKLNNETINKTPPQIGKKIPKITQIRNYLNSKYQFRNNIVSTEIEYKQKDQKDYQVLNENNLIVELLECGLNGVEKPLIALLKSDFTPRYNPIKEYCKNLPTWTPKHPDYITELATYVKAKDQHWFNAQFKKALVRMLACATGRLAFNKQCFTLVGGQNAGKSSFIRFLCPKVLCKHITDDIDIQNKDGKISLCTNMIINLDELDGLHRKEVNQVKKFMSLHNIKARLPYDRTDSYLERRASFFASTNETEFLTDTTGNVRWLVFPIHTIQHDNGKSKGYSKNIDIDLVYSQAYYLLNNGFEYELSNEEEKQSEANNKSHLVTSTEQDIIQEYLEPSDKENGQFATGGRLYDKVQALVTVKLNSKKFGQALRILGFKPVSHRTVGKKYPQKGYFVKSEYIIFS